MALDFKDIRIDKELEKLLPPLSEKDHDMLEQSLLKNGFKECFGKIKVWFPGGGSFNGRGAAYIVDGHNRYMICKKHNIALPCYCYEAVHFESKEKVVEWMYENQLARRNLSEMDRYETVEKYNAFLKEMARKNQSDGGKGLSNLTRINTRKEKAKMARISDGNYYKLDQIKKSGNKEIIEQVRHKKISIDKAYREIKVPKPKTMEPDTPEQRIKKIDTRMDTINKEISSLKTERESLICKRRSLFESLDIPCELRYEFTESKDSIWSIRKCRFFVEVKGYRQIFVECGVYCDENPDSVWLKEIPKKYRNDFIMLWNKAHKEEVEYSRKQTEEFNRRHKEALIYNSNETKDFYRQCYKTLAKNVHPDEGGSVEAMQCLNQLKGIWGV